MKLEDLAYAVVKKVFQELEHTHHFSVPEDIRKAVLEKTVRELEQLID